MLFRLRRGYTIIEVATVLGLVVVVGMASVAFFGGFRTAGQDGEARVSVETAMDILLDQDLFGAVGDGSADGNNDILDMDLWQGRGLDLTTGGSGDTREVSVWVDGWNYAAAAQIPGGDCWAAWQSHSTTAPGAKFLLLLKGPAGAPDCRGERVAFLAQTSFSSCDLAANSGLRWDSPLVCPGP